MWKRIILLTLTFLLTGGSALGQFKDQETRVTYKINKHGTESNNFMPLALQSDTTSSADSLTPKRNPVRVWPVVREFSLGTLWGALCTVPGTFIARGISGEDGSGGFGVGVIGAYTGFVFGTSLGVYLGTIEEKPNTSFFSTLGSGILGSGVGFGIHLLSDHNKITGTLPILLPIIVPILYVELFN